MMVKRHFLKFLVNRRAKYHPEKAKNSKIQNPIFSIFGDFDNFTLKTGLASRGHLPD